MALVPFLARPKPKITLLGLSLLQNPKATCLVSDVIAQSGVLQQSLGSFSSGFSFNSFLGGGLVGKGHEQTNKTKPNNNCSKKKKS